MESSIVINNSSGILPKSLYYHGLNKTIKIDAIISHINIKCNVMNLTELFFKRVNKSVLETE